MYVCFGVTHIILECYLLKVVPLKIVRGGGKLDVFLLTEHEKPLAWPYNKKKQSEKNPWKMPWNFEFYLLKVFPLTMVRGGGRFDVCFTHRTWMC